MPILDINVTKYRDARVSYYYQFICDRNIVSEMFSSVQIRKVKAWRGVGAGSRPRPPRPAPTASLLILYLESLINTLSVR